jgi:hypothetical protein
MKSREGWELYIVTDSVMLGIYPVMVVYPDHYAICHNIQLPSFYAFHDIGHHLSMFLLDSLIMAF